MSWAVNSMRPSQGSASDSESERTLAAPENMNELSHQQYLNEQYYEVDGLDHSNLQRDTGDRAFPTENTGHVEYSANGGQAQYPQPSSSSDPQYTTGPRYTPITFQRGLDGRMSAQKSSSYTIDQFKEADACQDPFFTGRTSTASLHESSKRRKTTNGSRAEKDSNDPSAHHRSSRRKPGKNSGHRSRGKRSRKTPGHEDRINEENETPAAALADDTAEDNYQENLDAHIQKGRSDKGSRRL